MPSNTVRPLPGTVLVSDGTRGKSCRAFSRVLCGGTFARKAHLKHILDVLRAVSMQKIFALCVSKSALAALHENFNFRAGGAAGS